MLKKTARPEEKGISMFYDITDSLPLHQMTSQYGHSTHRTSQFCTALQEGSCPGGKANQDEEIINNF